jgi:signal transduction histidine kinase
MPASVLSRLLRYTVHDLRNAINSLNLSVHLLESTLPRDDGPVLADTAMLNESMRQTQALVVLLDDFTRLLLQPVEARVAADSPLAMLEQAISQVSREHRASGRIVLEAKGAVSEEVRLDSVLACKALGHAIGNALLASGREVVAVRSGIGGGRWRITIATTGDPGALVQGGEISSREFARLVGNVQERQGVDLAILGRVTELFGGRAWLEVDAGKGSRIEIDWPQALDPGRPPRLEPLTPQ